MTEIDNITLIASSLLVFLAVVTPFVNVFFRRLDMSGEPVTDVVKAEEDEAGTPGTENTGKSKECCAGPYPAISIVLTPHENACELEENLPAYLSLDYAPGFEVIVVAWKGDTETEDVLKRYADNPHLYTTFIPQSSRYMSRKKLAVTLGVKAARNGWIMLTDIECRPQSEKWLQVMARNCNESTDLVLGYTRYDGGTPSYRRFERLHTELYLMREAQCGTAYRTGSKNLMFRKEMFIEQDGYRGNLKYLRGEYDFIVNKYAANGNVALETHIDGWTVEQKPTDKAWRNKHLFYIENRKHMLRSASHRILYGLDQVVMHLNYLLIIAAGVLSVLTERWIVTVAAATALMITMSLRTVIAVKTLRRFAEDIPSAMIVFYEIGVVWHRLGYMLRYCRADKNDFISHKI